MPLFGLKYFIALFQILFPILTGTPSAGGANIAYVTTAGGIDLSGTTYTAFNTASTLNVATGDALVVFCRQDNDTTNPSSVTDTAGNTFTHQTGADSTMGAADKLTVWTVLSATANSADTVTCNWAAAHAYLSIVARQYRGPAFSGVDATNGNNASGTAATSGTFSTTHANEVVVACASTTLSGNTFTAGLINGVTATNVAGDAAQGSANTMAEDSIVSATMTNATAAISWSAGNSNYEISVVSLF